MDQIQPLQLASVSKLLTAAAVLRALEVKNIDILTPVYHYFPSGWGPPKSDFKKITFLANLQYKVGISNTLGASGKLARIMGYYQQAGQFPLLSSEIGVVKRYNSTSYAWFRVIMAYMLVPEIKDTLNQLYKISPPVWHSVVSNFHNQYVRSVCFPNGEWAYPNPIGNGYSASSQTLYYGQPPPVATAGKPFPDWTLATGSGGWNVGMGDFRAFMHRLRWGNVLTTQNKNRIFSYATVNEVCAFDNRTQDRFGSTVFLKGGVVAGYCNATLLAFSSAPIIVNVATNCHPSVAALDQVILNAYNASWS